MTRLILTSLALAIFILPLYAQSISLHTDRSSYTTGTDGSHGLRSPTRKEERLRPTLAAPPPMRLTFLVFLHLLVGDAERIRQGAKRVSAPKSFSAYRFTVG